MRVRRKGRSAIHESVSSVESYPMEGANGRDRRISLGPVTTVCGLTLSPNVVIVKETANVSCDVCRTGQKA